MYNIEIWNIIISQQIQRLHKFFISNADPFIEMNVFNQQINTTCILETLHKSIQGNLFGTKKY